MACFGDVGYQAAENTHLCKSDDVNKLNYLPHQEPMMDEQSDLREGRLLGGAVGCQIVRTFPTLLAIKCLCFKCYVDNLPEFFSEDFAKCTCCPFFSSCGCENWKDPLCQLFCLKCAQTGPSMDTNFPACCKLKCLIYKCGIEPTFVANPMNKITNDDCCTSMCCCLHDDCGMKNWTAIQYFCLLLTF